MSEFALWVRRASVAIAVAGLVAATGASWASNPPPPDPGPVLDPNPPAPDAATPEPATLILLTTRAAP